MACRFNTQGVAFHNVTGQVVGSIYSDGIKFQNAKLDEATITLLKARRFKVPITKIDCFANGIFEKNIPVTLELQKFGANVAFFKLQSFLAPAKTRGTIGLVDAGGCPIALPEEFVPLSDLFQPVVILDEGVHGYGTITVKDGIITIDNAFSDFIGVGMSGLPGSICFTYITANQI
jgi:hypothetical protein